MDNDDTIRNLITYGDDNPENSSDNQDAPSDNQDIPPDNQEVPPDNQDESIDETKAFSINEVSSIEDNVNDDVSDEYFADDEQGEYADDDVKAYTGEYSTVIPEENPEFEEELSYEEKLKIKKKRYIKYAGIGFIIFVVMVILSMIDTGVIGRYKQNASNNIAVILDNIGIDINPKKQSIASNEPLSDTSAITEDAVDNEGKTEQTKVDLKATPLTTGEPEYNLEVNFSTRIPFESAAEAAVAVYKKGIVSAKTNYLCYIGGTGNPEWEITTSVIDPIMEAEGDYILIAQNGGNKVCLYNGNQLLYDIDIDNRILACAISSDGDAVLVTEKSSYKGGFSVYNRSGDEIYAWSSGADNIISADISASSRRVAVSLVDTDSDVKSTIRLFNINKKDSYASQEFNDTILFNVLFVGDEVHAFGDNSIIGMSTSGKLMYDKRFDDVELTNYAIDTRGVQALQFNSENIPIMNIYNGAGALKYTMTIQVQPDHIDIDSYNILYNESRNIYLGKPNSKKMAKYTASMDIKKLLLIDSRTFAVVYSNSIEFVRF